jgi:hemerythrin-like domain-containing protein
MLETLGEPMPPAYLETPLECIFADNFRCRLMCNALEAIAGEEVPDTRTLQVTRQFLARDFSFHQLDEEQGLFPLLRRRLPASDEVRAALPGLLLDHELVGEVMDGLTGLSRHGGERSQTLRSLLQHFAKTERRHVSVENVVVLPAARKRLSADDLALLSSVMRSIRQPGGGANVH